VYGFPVFKREDCPNIVTDSMIFKSGIFRPPHSPEGDAVDILLYGIIETGLGAEESRF
jgi:hypothetical protein